MEIQKPNDGFNAPALFQWIIKATHSCEVEGQLDCIYSMINKFETIFTNVAPINPELKDSMVNELRNTYRARLSIITNKNDTHDKREQHLHNG